MENRAEYRKELRKYAMGLGWALLLTAISFAVVAWHLLSPVWALTLIFTLGLIQCCSNYRGHFSLVVLFNLHSRMV